MNLLRTLRPALLACLGSLAAIAPADAQPVRAAHLDVELLAENQTLEPGAENWLALRLHPERGWHVYWRNPGDTGLPTRLNWSLPRGFGAGDLLWPWPERFTIGDLANYGYGAEVLHPVPLRIDADVEEGPALLSSKASWLVCAEVCIPGSAELRLELPVRRQTPVPQARWVKAFGEARNRLPQPVTWPAQFATDAQELRLDPGAPAELWRGARRLEFFPFEQNLLRAAARQQWVAGEGGIRMRQARPERPAATPERMDGVLVVEATAGTRAYALSARLGEVSALAADAAPLGAEAPPALGSGLGLATALLLALAGGLVLNLMPCVFPVLSLKALTVMRAQGDARGRHLAHALSYTAGVLSAFGLIGGLLLALRAGGVAVGWGFQLQSPVFLALLVYLLFALGLSLAGLVDFGTRWMGAGQALAARPGHAGSFFTGVLAVVVASPCTAPFMGSAMGYALTQPSVVALGVFLALGLGLALPFLLLGLFPALAAALPRPGAWMERFKQLLAFPLFATAIWLLWVLGGVSGRDSMALALAGLLLLGFALWLTRLRSLASRLLTLACIGAALGLLAHPLLRSPAATRPPATAQETWEPYSDARFAQLRSEGRTVFVDFTADWCLTCKLNERVTLRSDAVRAAFAAGNVALLRGDWTAANPEIADVLRRYGREGVPLYLVSRRGAEPEVLPQILTPGRVAEALRP